MSYRAPGSPEWRAHVAKMLQEESRQPLRWWYVSFVGEAGFIGGAMVQARGPTLALRRTHELRINPGDCEAGCTEVPAPMSFPTDRLLTKEELEFYDSASQDKTN